MFEEKYNNLTGAEKENFKRIFKNLLTNPRRCDRITLVPQERDETKKEMDD